MSENEPFNFLQQRRAGILLHPTSLPGRPENGDIGRDAYRFVEFLESCGISVWQTLPLGPTHDDGSPYQCLSAHAGNPKLISLEWLEDKGWLENSFLLGALAHEDFRQRCLDAAYHGFQAQSDPEQQRRFDDFCHQHAHWLDNYADYRAIRLEQQNRAWTEWPQALRDRDPDALKAAQNRQARVILQIQFEQFVFFSQWLELKHYAHQHGVWIFGDMPIFVAHDSADVWCHREYFTLDNTGQAQTVAGVPPDYFSQTGQRWGNPLYHWERMQQDNFSWWIQRMHSQLELFDIVRVDHFRGLEAYWEIPAESETAVAGHWVKAPGAALLRTLHDEFSGLPLVAEDLGVITPEVDELRKQFNLPGMKILQFAFENDPSNPYLPHNYAENSVVYTGTHDNDTTLSWFLSLTKPQQQIVEQYLGYSITKNMPWPLIRLALASVARLAMLPMQDILGLGKGERMNIPGTLEGNWQWRFEWKQLSPEITRQLHALVHRFGRAANM